MSKMKFPKIVKRGHTTVKIYRTPVKGYPQFTVVHYLGEKRQRRMFSDLALALTEAETIASKLSAGELNVLELRNEDRLAYVRAVEALKPTGTPLEMAAMQFAETWQRLGGVSLLEAANFYLKHHPQGLPRKTVAEVLEEMLAAKQADGASAVYLRDLRGRLERFRDAVGGMIASVTAPVIEDFLRGLKHTGVSRNSYRKKIGTLFRFAEQRGYLAKGDGRIDSVARAKEAETEIEIFTPEELGKLLGVCRPEIVPFLTIGAFAGLRSAELTRLDWHDVRLEDGFIEVKARKAKTASRRLVPLAENLKAWLRPYWRTSGRVCGVGNVGNALMDLAKEAEVKWKHNGLRHSFISYRVADIQNVAQVALEAGNSPQMIFKHYRELVRAADAKRWFALVPARDGKIAFFETKSEHHLGRVGSRPEIGLAGAAGLP
jgi:integrase